MSFFRRGQNQPTINKKRLVKGKGRVPDGPSFAKKQKKDVESNDEEITSDEDEEFFNKFKNKEQESQYGAPEEETPQEKKLRLAKKYLDELRQQKEEEIDDGDEVNKAIGLQLKEDVLEAAGKLQRSVADSYEPVDVESLKFLRCKFHNLPLTCLVVSQDEKYIFSSSKDSSIVKWSIEGQRQGVILNDKKCKEGQVGHATQVLSLAISSDGIYLASGDTSGIIHIWDAASLKYLKTFKKHRGAISGLTFRKGTHTLYSASHDRLVMAWNLDVMAFVESLGGHQEPITGIDALMKESCVTSGGRDEMVIVYVIPDEKQLRFSASQNSIDGIKLLNEKTFITYGENGSLALWTTLKKKPHSLVQAAHGINPEDGLPYWITALSTLVNTDIIASGSMDGQIRLWKVDHMHRRIQPLFSVPAEGVVNGLDFTPSGSHLVAALGKEHKLGRWYTDKSAKNGLLIIPLKKS